MVFREAFTRASDPPDPIMHFLELIFKHFLQRIFSFSHLKLLQNS